MERVKSVPAGSWLSVGNAREKKNQNRRGKKKTTKPTLQKIWGEGKEEKIKKGGWEEETRTKGENKIKKMENGKKKREKEKSK